MPLKEKIVFKPSESKEFIIFLPIRPQSLLILNQMNV